MSHKFLSALAAKWRGPAVSAIWGNRPYRLGQGEATVELIIKNPAFLRRMPLSPSLAFGEAYMNGEVEIEGSLMDLLIGFHASQGFLPPLARTVSALSARLRISAAKAAANARHHYDIGNDFYALWLGEDRAYSCAYFLTEDDDIDTAQQQKLELICRKTRLQAGQTLLDIGCGWGSLMFHAARQYGVHATGITPANEQANFIEKKARKEGLEDKIKVIRGDWRELTGQYDRVISVGMFEHVGLKQYPDFFDKWRSLLKDDSVSFLHTIGRMLPAPPDPWINKYIFPGGYLPSLDQIIEPTAKKGMMVVDVENLWHHYDLTLQRWLEGFERNVPAVTDMFDARFVRMWRLYLTASAAAFRAGSIHLWQLVILPTKALHWPLNREVNAQTLIARS